MVVKRCHQEDAPAFTGLAFGVFEPPDLQHDRQVFNQEDSTQHGQEELFADGNGKCSDDAAQRQASGITHEDLRREGVVPQEGDTPAHKGGDEDHQLLRAGDVVDVEVIRRDDVGAHIGQNRQAQADDCAAAGGQAVDAIREVGAIANCSNNQNHQRDERQPAPPHSPVAHPGHQALVIEAVVLHERHGGFGGLFRFPNREAAVGFKHLKNSPVGRRHFDNLTGILPVGGVLDGHVGMPPHDGADDDAHADLADDLEAACESFFVFLEDLDVVVDEADGAQPHRYEQHHLGVDVGQVGKQQRRNQDGREDDEAAHGRGALLVHLAFQPEVAHDFTYLLELQPFDDALAKEDANDQRRDQAHARAERDVLEQACAGHVHHGIEVGEEVVQHQAGLKAFRSSSRSSKSWRTPLISW